MILHALWPCSRAAAGDASGSGGIGALRLRLPLLNGAATSAQGDRRKVVAKRETLRGEGTRTSMRGVSTALASPPLANSQTFCKTFPYPDPPVSQPAARPVSACRYCSTSAFFHTSGKRAGGEQG